MKHLKLFEGFQESEYYSEIDLDEYDEMIHIKNNHENWSNLEKEHIKNFKIKGQLQTTAE